MSIYRKILEANKRFNLIKENDKILIGFSGGVDSVVLVYGLFKLKDALKIDIGLAHFNHQLREDAKEDENFCIDFAKSLKLDIYTATYDIKSLKGNIEKNAREKRYEFLNETAKNYGFNKIATAHHLDDLAETMILWLVRGGGLKGISGFRAFEKNIIRPLILCDKDQIRDFAKKEGLSWKEDYTNYDQTLNRNLIRHKIIPILKSINPNFLNTLLQESLILQDEEAFLDKYTTDIISTIDPFDIKSLKNQPVAIQRRIVRKVFNTKTFAKTELVLKLLEGAKQIRLKEDKILYREKGKIKIKNL